MGFLSKLVKAAVPAAIGFFTGGPAGAAMGAMQGLGGALAGDPQTQAAGGGGGGGGGVGGALAQGRGYQGPSIVNPDLISLLQMQIAMNNAKNAEQNADASQPVKGIQYGR